MYYSKYYVAIMLSSCSYFATAADDFSLCRPLESVIPTRPVLSSPAAESIRLSADELEGNSLKGVSTFRGHVVAQRNEQIITSPELHYQRDESSLTSDQAFTFWDTSLIVQGEKLQLTGQKKQGVMFAADYWLLGIRGRGSAEKISQQDENVIHLDGAHFTTCDAEDEMWKLTADRTILDRNTGIGKAHHVSVRFLNLPLFYTPYLSFPITGERTTGFLAPSMGSSDETGIEITLPYYINLAPNYDATITPRIMSRRGLLLGGEFRYLTLNSIGKVEAEYLAHDKSFGDKRALFKWQHRAQLTSRLSTDINFNYVSDDKYFGQLGNNLSIASITHLERRATLSYLGNGWGAQGMLQAYQTLDPAISNRPYQRLPQLLFKSFIPKHNKQLNFDIQAEFVHFARHLEVDVSNPTGNRMDVYSSVSYPWRTSSGFIIPKLSARHTFYDLENDFLNTNETINRSTYTASLDSGLFFEKELTLFDTKVLHTLEPRIFYRNTPYQDQTDIPIFDTAEYDFSFGQLFRENSFSGTDRIDDNHQVTLALTSRVLNQYNGTEHLRASIGQVRYLRDRKVSLDNTQVNKDNDSDIIAEIASQFAKDWTGSSTVQWDNENNEVKQSVWRLRYHPSKTNLVNLSYRFKKDKIEQTDISFYWPIGRRWNMLGRWNYSFQNHSDLEIFTGFEYNSCCWSARVLARRYLNTLDGRYLNGFFFQLELKGLGNVGRKANGFLEDSIYGYYDKFK